MTKLSILLILILTILSCQKKSDNEYQIGSPVFMENKELANYIGCFYVGNIDGTQGFVINDSATFKIYEDSMRLDPYNVDCDTSKFVEIDFNTYTLLGIKVGYSACDSLAKNIYVDNKKNKIVYNVDLTLHVRQACLGIYYIPLNLVLINKIPENYDVEFVMNTYE